MSQENLLLSLHIASSSASDIAFSLMWGIVLLLYWSALPHTFLSRLYKLFGAAAIILCIALPLQLLLLAVDMAGTMHWSELSPILPDVLAMHAGSVLRLQFVCTLLALFFAMLPLPQTMRRLLLIATLLVLTIVKAAAGHAATDGAFSVREFSQWIHLISIASWAGGILIAASIVLPHLGRESAMLPLFLRRLSLQATISVAFVFLSGLFNSWLITEGQWAPLRSSTWGAVLITKIVLVLFVLGIGFLNRRDLRHKPTTNFLDIIIKRIRLEALLMLVILCASGWLSNLSPT